MLDAGSVVTTLRFKLDASDAKAYEARMRQSVAAGEAAEARIKAAQARVAASHDRVAQSAERVRQATGRMVENASLASLDRWDKSSRKAAQSASELGRAGAKTAAVGFLGLAAATVYAINKAGDFEKQMRNVNSIAKLSEAQYQRLSKSVLELSGETAQAPHVLAEGMYQLVSSGFSANDSLKILHASAKAATAGLTDTATATTAVAAVLNAYRLPASQAGHVSDVLFETVNRGVLTFDELSKSIGDALPFAASLGVTLPELGAAISTMTKEGINAPETLTRIKREMQSFIKPSADMSAAIKETGASSAEALVKQKGLQGAVEAVIKTTDGSKASIAKLFPDIRALGGALALTGKNAKSAQGDLKAFSDTSGAAEKVFKEQSKSAAFAGKELLSQLETAAIVVGDKFLPILAKGAHSLTATLQHAAADGTLDRIGNSMLAIFTAVAQAAGELVSALAPVAHIALDVAGALSHLASSAGLDLGGQLASLAAGFLAFKAVSTIGPILLGLADGFNVLRAAAATAPSLGAFVADLSEAGILVPGIGLALAGAAGAFVAFKSGLFDSASAAEKDAAALRDVKKATEDLKDATHGAADAEQERRRADLEKKRADLELSQTRRAHKEGKASQTDVEAAELRDAEANLHQLRAIEHERGEIHKERSAAENKSYEAGKRREQLEGEIANKKAVDHDKTKAETLKDLVPLQNELNKAIQEERQAIAEAGVAELSRIRESRGVKNPGIQPKFAPDIKELQIALSAIPKNLRLKFELADQGTMAKLGALSHQLEQMGQGATMVKILTNAPSAGAAVAAMRAVVAGVPGQKVIRILHNAGSVKQKVDELNGAVRGLHGKNIPLSTNALQAILEVEHLQGAIDGLVGKTVTVVVNTVNKALKFAAGRADGQAQAAMVGEGGGPEWIVNSKTGAGYKTAGPMLTSLSAYDYVIPTEDRYRGRALGLLAMLAKDLGAQGYAKGKKPTKSASHPMPIPDAIPPLSLPLTDIESKQSDAKQKYDSAHNKAHQLADSVHGAQSKKSPNHNKLGQLQAQLRTAKRAEAKRHQELREWNRTLKEAKAFDHKIKVAEQEVSNDRAAMAAAAAHGNYDAYSAAKGKRLKALGHLQDLVNKAQAQVKVGSLFGLQLAGQLAGYEEEATQAEAEEPPALTPEQESQRKSIEAAEALAALTPGLGDDTVAAQQLVSFFEGALTSAQQRGAPSDAIIELAGQVKTARQNLESLTNPSGGATNENQDLQAQITQANERADQAQRTAQIAEQALSVFGGSGDIGAGGPNARAAVTQNIYTLHPGDPATLRAIGNAATAGQAGQGARPSKRVRVGP
jgi:TP901 family phage tail tape measure protein